MMRLWQERTPREQVLLAVMGAVLFGLTVWQGLLVPLDSWRADAARGYVQAQDLLDQVREGAREARALEAVAAKRAAEPSGSLRATLTRTARAGGVTISRLEPAERGGLTVWLEEVETATLQSWLVSLYRDHGIAVARASVRRHDAGPAVRAQITFENGASS